MLFYFLYFFSETSGILYYTFANLWVKLIHEGIKGG